MLELEPNTKIINYDIDNDPEMFIGPNTKQIFKVRYGMAQKIIKHLYTCDGYKINIRLLKSELGLIGDIVEASSSMIASIEKSQEDNLEEYA